MEKENNKENKKENKKENNKGRYVCPYCGKTDNYPLNNHNCWQKNSKPMGPNENGLYPDEY
jgi:hypothetical protein